MASSFVHELPPYVRREPREGTRGAPALDGEGMAGTETADRSALAASSATQLAPRQHTVYFSRRVWTRGVTQAAGAGALFSIAVFLLFQIPSTPALRNASA